MVSRTRSGTRTIRWTAVTAGCIRVELEEPAKAGARRRRGPNDDLVKAAESVLPLVRAFYERLRDGRPVMLLDPTSRRVYAYPYEGFRADLSERS
jgi:hypothetical protein